MGRVIHGLLRLCRPANLPTAMADIFAGAAIAGLGISDILEGPGLSQQGFSFLVLLLSSTVLYAGGVVLNDVFDYKIDLVERPERPIPQGMVSVELATVTGVLLLVFGIVLAFFVATTAGIVAAGLASAILVYDGFTKKHDFLGPLTMGVCRALNLILGMAIWGQMDSWWFGIIPLLYIFAITLISRGEVHGKNKSNIIKAAFIYAVVIFLVLISIALHKVEMESPGGEGFDSFSILDNWSMLLCLGLFGFLNMTSLIKAFRRNTPLNIKKAVITGVLSIIVLDATFVMAFDTWMFGLIVLLLLPLSVVLSKIFAVT
ncbi:UbiA-like protein EboC [Eudoraea chungangensis]|uniref:UbiA-like protein EboC n=1 Tax=Eudoraea chungangensis TaxID=1481905 RepID=UPI0023EA9717|nr:UbiA-like protein EboC [Eudoraea chungangensis]